MFKLAQASPYQLAQNPATPGGLESQRDQSPPETNTTPGQVPVEQPAENVSPPVEREPAAPPAEQRIIIEREPAAPPAEQRIIIEREENNDPAQESQPGSSQQMTVNTPEQSEPQGDTGLYLMIGGGVVVILIIALIIVATRRRETKVPLRRRDLDP